MKRLPLLLLIGCALLAGCASRYAITLTNGNRLNAVGKPRLEGGSYVFKDTKGQTIYLPAGRVREVAPASMAGSRMQSGVKTVPSK